MNKLNLKWVIDNLDLVFLLLTSVINVLLTFYLGKNLEDQKMASIVLIAIVSLLIAMVVFLTKRFSMSKSVSSIEEKISHLTATEVLRGREACFRKLNSVITENSNVDVTYFTPEPPPSEGQLARNEEEYWRKSQEYLNNSLRFELRRIVTVESKAKLEWVKDTVEKMRKYPRYNLAVLTTEQPFNYINLIVVDNRYTMIFPPHREPAHRSRYVFIDDKTIAKDFGNDVFDRLWDKAKEFAPLKIGANIYDGNDGNEDNFRKIEEILS